MDEAHKGKDPFSSSTAWLNGGEDRDVAVYCRARFGRNLRSHPFPWRASAEELRGLREQVAEAVRNALPGSALFRLEELGPLGVAVFAERGWCGPSDELDPCRAVFLHGSGRVVSVNAVDHVRINRYASGSDLEGAYRSARETEETLDRALDWACTEDLGFLSSRLSDSGSGLRVSALVFIPGILGSSMFDRVSRGLLAKGIEPRLHSRRTEQGSPMEPSPFMELSGHCPLDMEEGQYVRTFRETLGDLIQGERKTRDRMAATQRLSWENRAYRAAALLRASGSLDLEEAETLLIDLRFAVSTGSAPPAKNKESDPYSSMDRLRYAVLPGNIRFLAKGAEGDEISIGRMRAELVRAYLPRYHIDGGPWCSKD
jgi:protein arginine kinase